MLHDETSNLLDDVFVLNLNIPSKPQKMQSSTDGTPERDCWTRMSVGVDKIPLQGTETEQRGQLGQQVRAERREELQLCGPLGPLQESVVFE